MDIIDEIDLREFKLYENRRYTSICESFAHKILKYASKDIYYTSHYAMRSWLAALDQNENTGKKKLQQENSFIFRTEILDSFLKLSSYDLTQLKTSYKVKLFIINGQKIKKALSLQ